MRISVPQAVALVAVTLAGASVIDPSPRIPGAGSATAPGDLVLSAFPQEVPQERPVDARTLLRTAGMEMPGENDYREFYFTRGVYSEYSGGWGWRRERWATDYPKADIQFLAVLRRLIDIDAYPAENAVRLDDPGLRRFPLLYILEISNMDLSDEEVRALRSYLEAGGFLVVDDFWGNRAMQNLYFQLQRVLPGREMRPVPQDHPIFNAVYDIERIQQVPNVGQGRSGGPTTECWGCEAQVWGVYEDFANEGEHGRLMAVIHWNTDLGDAWEWAEDPYYPLLYSTFAYEMGVNMVVYAMSH